MRLWKCAKCGGTISTLGETPMMPCGWGGCGAIRWIQWNPYTNEAVK